MVQWLDISMSNGWMKSRQIDETIWIGLYAQFSYVISSVFFSTTYRVWLDVANQSSMMVNLVQSLDHCNCLRAAVHSLCTRNLVSQLQVQHEKRFQQHLLYSTLSSRFQRMRKTFS